MSQSAFLGSRDFFIAEMTRSRFGFDGFLSC